MHAHELTVPDRQIHFIAAAHSLSRKRPSADDTSCDAEPMPRHWKSAAGRVQPTPGRKDQHALTWIRAKRRSSLGERTNGPPHPAPATASRRLPLPFPGVAQRWIPPPRIIVQIRRPPHPLHAVGPRFTQPSPVLVRTDHGAQPTGHGVSASRPGL